jgi:CRISPR/Cas system-associated exonuclease Cas4 (RecB family)
MELAIRYYELKFGNHIDQAFIHLIREIGQTAYALETKNEAVFNAKVTEAIALLKFLAHKHNVNIESNIETMYSKKLALINHKDTENR